MISLIMVLAMYAIKIGIPILLAVFLIKGIKYLNKKNSEDHRD